MCERDDSLSRRHFLGAAASSMAGAAIAAAAPASAAATRRAPKAGPVGAGGVPTDLAMLATLAKRVGRGQPLVFVDLAALDQNTGVILEWAGANGFAVRPALKAFQSPGLCAYALRLMPEPRGMVFHLHTVDEIMRAAPPGTDLMMGYPPTAGELEAFLGSSPPRAQRAHTLRLLVDGVPLMQRLARLARRTRRPLPLDVALEFDSGMGRGGIETAEELTEVLRILHAGRKRLRLGAVLCYDGHATLTGDAAYRELVARTSQQRFRGYLDQLTAEGADLHDSRTLIRNGPASSNYRNWAGTDVANEISPGSAFLYAGYLEDFDHAGLAPAVTQASPLMRITSDHPSVPGVGATSPGANEEEVVIKAGPWAGSEIVHPEGMREDPLSGGGFALVAPKNALELGDYVLMRPAQTGDGIDPFAEVVAIRGGRVRRRWATFSRWRAR